MSLFKSLWQERAEEAEERLFSLESKNERRAVLESKRATVLFLLKKGGKGKWWANGYVNGKRILGGVPFASKEELINALQAVQGCRVTLKLKE